jgi:hypothetical protein
VRLSEKEHQKLTNAIAKCGTTKSAFIRTIANLYIPKERPPDKYYEFISRLSELGNNLYQISSSAKMEGVFDVKELEEQVKNLDALLLAINSFYTVPDKIKGGDIKWLQQKYGTSKEDLTA